MKLLKEIDAEIATLEREIRATLALAQKKRQEHKELIAARKKHVRETLMVDFPPEILHRIFKHALSVEVFDHRTERLRTNIRLVSSQWNQVILADASFWTSIFISFATNHIARSLLGSFMKPLQDEWPEVPDLLTTAEDALERIRRRIAHSHSQPLDLRLSYVAGAQGVCEEPLPGLARLIQENKFRSIFIELHYDLDDCMDFPFLLFQPRRRPRASGWPGLESLHLKVIVEGCFDGVRAIEAPPYHDTPALLLPASTFPALRNVTLEVPRADLLKWGFPWEQLVTLKIMCFRNAFADYVPILGKCRALQELYITVDLPDRGEPLDCPGAVIGADRLIRLPLLNTLVIQVDIKCNILTALVPKLILPRLRTLEYHNSIDLDKGGASYSTEVLKALSGLAKYSGASLRSMTLRLHEMTLDDRAFSRLLALMPALTTLELAAQRLTCDFLSTLSKPPFVTNLRSVIISNMCRSAKVDPRSKFAKWAEVWAQNHTGAKDEIEAGYVTMIPSQRHDLELADEHLFWGRKENWDRESALQGLQNEGYNVWEEYVLD